MIDGQLNDKQPMYRFSDAELRALVAFFRQRPPIPDELYAFTVFAEQYLYRNLTIGEAEQLYGNR